MHVPHISKVSPQSLLRSVSSVLYEKPLCFHSLPPAGVILIITLSIQFLLCIMAAAEPRSALLSNKPPETNFPRIYIQATDFNQVKSLPEMTPSNYAAITYPDSVSRRKRQHIKTIMRLLTASLN